MIITTNKTRIRFTEDIMKKITNRKNKRSKLEISYITNVFK